MNTAHHLSTLTRDTRSAVERLLAFAESQGIEARITSSRRSCAEQDALSDEVTGVRGCRSWHVHGRAVDLYLGRWDPEPYALLGAEWKRLGGVWGGDFKNIKDYAHFEWHPGLSIDDVCPVGTACEDGGGGSWGPALLGAGAVFAGVLLWRTR